MAQDPRDRDLFAVPDPDRSVTRPMTDEELAAMKEEPCGDRETTVEEAVQALAASALELQKRTKGRRFSTHEEGQATMRLMFEWAMEDMNHAADGFMALWNMLKEGNISEEYYDVLQTSSKYLSLGTAQLIDLMAAMAKLAGGVVHEPK